MDFFDAYYDPLQRYAFLQQYPHIMQFFKDNYTPETLHVLILNLIHSPMVMDLLIHIEWIQQFPFACYQKLDHILQSYESYFYKSPEEDHENQLIEYANSLHTYRDRIFNQAICFFKTVMCDFETGFPPAPKFPDAKECEEVLALSRGICAIMLHDFSLVEKYLKQYLLNTDYKSKDLSSFPLDQTLDLTPSVNLRSYRYQYHWLILGANLQRLYNNPQQASEYYQKMMDLIAVDEFYPADLKLAAKAFCEYRQGALARDVYAFEYSLQKLHASQMALSQIHGSLANIPDNKLDVTKVKSLIQRFFSPRWRDVAFIVPLIGTTSLIQVYGFVEKISIETDKHDFGHARDTCMGILQKWPSHPIGHIFKANLLNLFPLFMNTHDIFDLQNASNLSLMYNIIEQKRSFSTFNLGAPNWAKCTELQDFFKKKWCTLQDSFTSSKTPSMLLQYNELLQQHKDFRKADIIATYQHALQCSPDSYLTLKNLGMTFIENEEYDQARECFDRIHVIDPLKIDSWICYANLHEAQDEFEQGIEILKKGKELVLHQAELDIQIAKLYALLENDMESFRYFHLSVEAEPHNPRYLLQAGFYYADHDDQEAAYECFSTLQKLYPTNYHAINGFALLESQINRNSLGAIKLFEQSLHLAPWAMGTWIMLGQMQFQQELFDASYQSFLRAFSLHPEDPIVLHYLGLLEWILKQDVNQSRNYLLLAWMQDLDNYELGLNLVQLYLERDDLNQAKSLLKLMKNAYPEEKEVSEYWEKLSQLQD